MSEAQAKKILTILTKDEKRQLLSFLEAMEQQKKAADVMAHNSNP